MQKRSLIFLFALLTVACDPADEKQSDTGTTDVGTNDTRQAEDTSRRSDIGDDAKTDPDHDMATQDMAKPDMGSGGITAVLGDRCEPGNRIGIVVVDRARQLRVSASLFDAPSPTITDPILSDAQCSFYDFKPDTPCADCGNDKVCNISGTCVPRPNLVTDGKILIANTTESKTIVTTNGSLSDSIALDGDTFTIELTWSGQKVTLPKMKIPSTLDKLEGTLDGTYDSPDGLDFTWLPPGGSSRVFTHININHHVSTPTFVECDVAAALGKFAITGDMLKPLSVSTGLEFQTIDHVNFAAAQTPSGCVEFRFQTSNNSIF